MLKNTMPSVCKYYSSHKKTFAVYPSQIDHRKEVVDKAKKLRMEMFWRADFNNFRYDSVSKTTGQPYSHFIRVCNPVMCSCSTFLDLAYCHHILAINYLDLANIILDPTYVKPPEPRRLQARKGKKGRPASVRGKAIVKTKLN